MSLLRSITGQDVHGCVHMQLEGELDAYSSEGLRESFEELATRGVTTVEVDLQRVTFIDSGGLAALLAGTRWLRQASGDLVIKRPPPAASRVFEITGLHKFLTIDEQDDR